MYMDELTEPVQGQSRHGPSTEKDEWTQSPTPTKKLFAVDSVGKGETSFPEQSVTGLPTTLQGKPHAKEQQVNTKQTPWGSVGFLFHFVLFGNFWLISLSFVYFDFLSLLVCLFERERKNMKVGAEEGYDQNILCESVRKKEFF